MDAATLRLILTVVGAALVLALYLWERNRCEDADDGLPLPAADRQDPIVSPLADDEYEDDDVADLAPAVYGERKAAAVARLRTLFVDASGIPESSVHLLADASPDAASNIQNIPDPLIVQFGVRSREGDIAGPDILDAAARCGLRPGESGAFHRKVLVGNGGDPEMEDDDQAEDEGGGGTDDMRTLFSMVSMVKPGEFPFDAMDDFHTRGLVLYSVLRSGQGGVPVLDEMLAVARRLAEEFDAELLDERRKPLTTFMVDTLRARVRELDRLPPSARS